MSQEDKGVWIYSDSPALAYELLAKGRQLADQLGTVLTAVTADTAKDGQDYVEHGADRVILLINPALKHFQVDIYTDALADLSHEQNPEVLLIGATRNGLEFAPRLAERLKTGYVTEATRLELDAEKKSVLMDRLSLGGNLLETIVSKVKPQIATIPKGIFPALPADPSRKGKVVKPELPTKPPTTSLVDVKPKTAKGTSLSDAQIIVSFGRGVRKKEDMSVIEQFAQSLGAVVGCSRPIAEDLKWLPEERYVGLSGQKVSPKLYIACGISGQIQHLTGIRNSRIIVAINNDPKAPIFEFCDYGVVGDLYQVLPTLADTVKQAR